MGTGGEGGAARGRQAGAWARGRDEKEGAMGTRRRAVGITKARATKLCGVVAHSCSQMPLALLNMQKGLRAHELQVTW